MERDDSDGTKKEEKKNQHETNATALQRDNVVSLLSPMDLCSKDGQWAIRPRMRAANVNHNAESLRISNQLVRYFFLLF